MKKNELLPGTICRDFKGKLYQIMNVAKDAVTYEDIVVYQQLYGKFESYVRTLQSFVEDIDSGKYPGAIQNKRFKIVRKEELDSDNTACSSAYLVKKTNEEVEIEAIDYNNSGISDQVNPVLLKFLEAETYEEKLNILITSRSDIDDRIINGMAVSLDVVIPEGDIDERYFGFKNCLETFRKYECNRFVR